MIAALTLSATNVTTGRAGALLGDANTAVSFAPNANGSATSAALSISGPVSVAAWVKVASTQPSNARVVVNWDGTKVNYLLAWSADSASMRFVVDNAPGGSGVRRTALKAYPYVVGWHFVVGVYDGAFLRLYLDGADVNDTAMTGSLYTAAANPTTGQQHERPGRRGGHLGPGPVSGRDLELLHAGHHLISGRALP